jgi:hypothetical protein
MVARAYIRDTKHNRHGKFLADWRTSEFWGRRETFIVTHVMIYNFRNFFRCDIK